MTHKDDTDNCEIAVFKEFVEISKLPIIDISIIKMPEPHPDIKCQDSSGNNLAFELVELIDESYAAMSNWDVEGKNLLYSLYNELDKEELAKLAKPSRIIG